MKIEVFEGTPKAPEQVLRLRLVQEHDYVVLCAVDEKGNRVSSGNLLAIYADGRIVRIGSVNTGLGLQLDYDRRVIIY